MLLQHSGWVVVCRFHCMRRRGDMAVSPVLSVFLLAALQLPHLPIRTASSFRVLMRFFDVAELSDKSALLTYQTPSDLQPTE